MYEGLGTEEVVDEVFLVLRDSLNSAIESQQARMDEIDQERAARLGIPLERLVIEPVDVTSRPGFPFGNFHVGSIPSFVQDGDRVENYPMVAVTAGRTVPAGDGLVDQLRVFNNAVSIHSFGRANPQEGPEVAYRRVMRMAEAVHQIVHGHPQLRDLLQGVQGPTLVERSEPWLFPVGDGHGEDWCWMAVMHQYQIKNYSTAPREV